MKTKIIIRSFILAAFAAALTLTSCKKDNKDPEPDTSSLQQLSKDENRVANATDAILNEVNDVISHSGNKSLSGLPCNAIIDSSAVVNDTIIYYITYNGLNCAGTYNRSGQATAKKNVNTPWSQAGCRIYVDFVNLNVTRVSDNKSVVISGHKMFENVSGGLLKDLGTTLTSVVHRVTGNIQATFDDNTTRTWSIARQRTFTGSSGSYEVTTEGFGTADGYGNLVTWGINRNGENFYTQINQAIVYRESCGWDPVSGIKVYQIPADNKKATFTAGFDDNNMPVSGGACPTRYRLDWEKNGQSGTLYIQM